MAHLVTESTLNTSQPHDTSVHTATNDQPNWTIDWCYDVTTTDATSSISCGPPLVECGSPCAEQRGKSVILGASFERGQSDTSHGGRHGVGPGTHRPTPSDNHGYVKLDARRAQNDECGAVNDGAVR
jgi:hypothetical protein